MRNVHYQNDPRLQTIRSESEQLIEADDHAVDRLIPESTQHLARGRILDQLHRLRIEVSQLAREVELDALVRIADTGVQGPEVTPVRRLVSALFAQLALRMSRVHKAYFLDLYPPNEQRLAEFASEARESLERQQAVEAADRVTFDQFLSNYFRP